MIPVVDNRHTTQSSFEITDSRVWNRQLSKRVWDCYLSTVDEIAPDYAVPATAGDLSYLPSAFISIENCDLLRDEGIEYAQRLMQAGNSTELHVYPDTFHGSFILEPDADTSRQHINDMVAALKRAFSSN